MRKKIEIVNRADLAAKQEIKNYQDSLNFVLQSIRELKESVGNVNQEQLENYAALHSAYIRLQSDVSCLKDHFFSLGLRFERAQKDQKHKNDDYAKSISALEEDIVTKLSNEQILKSDLDSTIQSVSCLNFVIESMRERISQDISSISAVYQKDIQRTKEEIINLPCKSDSVRKELTEKIDSHKVDVAGIMRELGIYKHDNYITQKKIENIYTLIDRLNKR